MADNLDTPSFGNFGIEDTMDMGIGNTQLLDDLFSPETSTEDPDKLETIVKTADEPKAPKKPEVSKGKEVVQKLDGEEKDSQDILRNFLGDDDEDEETEDDVVTAPIPAKAEEEEDDVVESPFVSLSKDLFKLGVFTQDDDEEDAVIETPEQFLEKFNTEKKKGAIEIVDNFIGQFGEDYQKAFDAIFVKGTDPKDYFGIYNNVVSFAELDLSIEDNQVRVIKQALTDQGFDTEDVTTEIDRLRNYGDLETVASKHHKVLVKKEAAKLQQLEQQSEQLLQQKAMIRNQYIQNVQSVLQDKLKTKEFDGIPLNPKLASELQDFLLVDKYKTPSGETLTDFDKTILELKRPENHATKVKVGLLLKILEKDPTLSTIQRSGVTKKSTQLFEEVARQTSKKPGSGGNAGKANSWFL
tara:strand:+ start:383 stop:1618 length:1236 start_codon:yes stop_codon:yes gene_type:complete